MKLVEYNRDDCLALRVVTEFIASIRNREAEGGTRYWEPDTIVHTGELISAVPGKHRFRRAHFFLPDLEFVNRHAYFDHRDTVYPRSRQSARVTKPHHKPKRRRPAKINKRIELRCKRCPHCNSRRLSEGKVFSTRIIDLKFLASGVKKWVTTYSAYEYRCDKCRKTFKSPDYPDWKSAYGDGLMTWAIYQNVALGQNMSKVEQGLRDVFKLNIPQPTMYRFKGLMARRYEPTKETIFAELLRGPSLSVDETEARLRNEKAHVWVFAGRSGAYYEYRESRNGQFLIERLSGFDGVLVSDFFTAYDAVKNPQQKCLIHLIRDMNEDVKASPFDTELRDIVQAFALVIRPIIETVDRYGLTKSRLQKHKIKAMEFVEKIAGDRVLSEAARKYQSRIEKYGDRLFTFLDYDGVPWHNNDAEHAIKAFARYRRFADGTFTKQSVSDYLTLLSIVQTCEYQGKKILQVLLNKEVKFTFGRPYSAHAGTA